jgi:predicted nucleic acid-binding protein
LTTFLDTSGVLALLDADDAHHPEADAVWNRLILSNERLVSSNYVLIELIALVQRRLGMDAVQAIYNVLVPLLEVEWIDREIHEAASADLVRAWRRHLSLVDCSSFIVMRKLGLTKVFSFDSHFPEHGFEQIPAQASDDSALP